MYGIIIYDTVCALSFLDGHKYSQYYFTKKGSKKQYENAKKKARSRKN